MHFTEELLRKAQQRNKCIVLPEADDDRTLQAADRLTRDGICRVVLTGDPGQIQASARKAGADVSRCAILSPADETEAAPLAQELHLLRKNKGLTLEAARELIKDPLYFATMLLKVGRVDGYVAGATHTTAENLRPALQIIKATPGLRTVSSFFLMVFPEAKWGHQGVLLYSDCGMVEQPSAEQLADIAIASARTFRQLVGAEPRVAMLSYSTKGSANSPDTRKVVKAVELAREMAPEIVLDGEMQADAALIPSIGERKCQGSPVAGKANCLIFPDLDAGNIAYKLTERLGGAQALGPLVQGMAKPAHDLSRGCSADDIVKVAAISAIMAD